MAVVARIQNSQDRVAGGYEAGRIGLRNLRFPAVAIALAIDAKADAAIGR